MTRFIFRLPSAIIRPPRATTFDKMKHCDCNVVHYVGICCAQTNIVENIIINRDLSSPFGLKSATLKFERERDSEIQIRANVRQNII